MQSIDSIDIDPTGIFKYILIKCRDNAKNEKYIIRGYKACAFHADIFDLTEEKLGKDFKLICLGGGRIRMNPTDKDILVYGYSQGYGRADHSIAVTLLTEKYPDYNITYSNDGY